MFLVSREILVSSKTFSSHSERSEGSAVCRERHYSRSVLISPISADRVHFSSIFGGSYSSM